MAVEANLAVVDVIAPLPTSGEGHSRPGRPGLAWATAPTNWGGAVPIPGTRRAARVEENFNSLDVALTDGQLAALDAAGAAVSDIGTATCRGLGRRE